MDKTRDAIKGMIWGQCLGDAVGLITEFKFKQDITFDENDLPCIEFPYRRKIRGFPKCDWTDDSDHMILTMQSLTHNELVLNLPDFASRLVQWCRGGFSELNDTHGMGMGGTINMCQIDPQFPLKPLDVGYEIWRGSGFNIAANGSLMRTSILSALCSSATGEWNDVDYQAVISYSGYLCRTTHADPRCVASCVLYNSILYKTIHQRAILIEEELRAVDGFFDVPETSTKARGVPSGWKPEGDYRKDFTDYVNKAMTSPIADLKLDERGKIGYVLKCLGCALYGLNVINQSRTNTPSFKKFIYKIVGECGDADTNAAVAGGLMGAYLGYSGLPQDWIKATPNHKWLDRQIDAFIAQLFKPATYDVITTA